MLCTCSGGALRWSIRADISVFILSVLGHSNVLLSRPDPNFTNLLTQYLAKLGELHQIVSYCS